MPVIRKAFGRLQDGRSVGSHVLCNERSGFAVEVLEYGATIRAIRVPARDGRLVDAVLSYPSLADYTRGNAYLGATIGRVAGRTAADAQSRLPLTRNEQSNHLHGGVTGFSHCLWQVAASTDDSEPTVRLRHRSPRGEDGYPGEVAVEAEFTLIGDCTLRVVLEARSDADTPLNLTLHPYFNLDGDADASIDSHRLRIAAAHILPLGADRLPTGGLLNVEATPFDFRRAQAIGAAHYDGHAQLRISGGYDHYYVLDTSGLDTSGLDRSGLDVGTVAADLYSPATALGLRLRTNQRGLQFYSGNQLDAAAPIPFRARSGLCLEPHAFPNAINQPNFPDITVRAGESYRHETRYEFYRGEG